MGDSIAPDGTEPKRIGRYLVYGAIAAGGMATVHFGRLIGARRFQRTIAVKRLHPNVAREEELVTSFLDEANLAARIRHPNVVQVLDVVSDGEDLLVIMEYVDGETLVQLERAAQRQKRPVPLEFASAVLVGVLHGLHAAHEARDDGGNGLRIVHRDVSPQNIMVGRDGVARVLDFGIAKACHRLRVTAGPEVKGKPRYMAPEQARGQLVDARTDVFAAGVVLWELIAGRPPFSAEREPLAILTRMLSEKLPALASIREDVPPAFDEVVRRALARSPARRFESAREFAEALAQAVPPATPQRLGEWVQSLVGDALSQRDRALHEIVLHSNRFAASKDDRQDLPASVDGSLSLPEAGAADVSDDAGGHTGRLTGGGWQLRVSLAPFAGPRGRWLALGTGMLGLLAFAGWMVRGFTGEPAAALGGSAGGASGASARSAAAPTASPSASARARSAHLPPIRRMDASEPGPALSGVATRTLPPLAAPLATPVRPRALGTKLQAPRTERDVEPLGAEMGSGATAVAEVVASADPLSRRK